MTVFDHTMLRSLKAGWDSYDAKPIDPRCIEKAFQFWREFPGDWTVVPCADGGVQLEQHRDGLNIEIRVSPASAQETLKAPEAPEKTWDCGICGRSNFVTVTHCEQCEYSRMVTREGRLVLRGEHR